MVVDYAEVCKSIIFLTYNTVTGKTSNQSLKLKSRGIFGLTFYIETTLKS